MRHILALATFTLVSATFALAQPPPKGLFTEPDSMLLFGTEYEGDFQITTPLRVLTIPDPLQGKQLGYFPMPALAPSGDRVAWMFPALNKEGNVDHYVLGVFSPSDRTWKIYGEFCHDIATGGAVAFSPEGTRIALVARPIGSRSGTDCSYNRAALQILDLATGGYTQIPYPASYIEGQDRLSWSPDGRYLAAQVAQKYDSAKTAEPPPLIVIIDISSGAAKAIAEGLNPSWSPKGDWIAYIDRGMGQKCMLIHPDGTGARVVHDAHGKIFSYWFPYSAEWSPDGTTLLVNEWYGEGEKSRVLSLNVATGKTTTMSHNAPWVFGWSRLPAP